MPPRPAPPARPASPAPAARPASPARPAPPAPPALVLATLFVVWQPFSLAMTMSGLVDELSARGVGLGFLLLLRLFAAGLGIAAGLALFRGAPGAATLAKASLVTSAVVDVVAYVSPWSPNNRPPGDAAIILAVSLLYYACWYAYLARSKRVRDTYP